MSFAKKVIVAVSPADNIEELLLPLKEMNFFDQSEVHFVNVFNTITYSHWLSSTPLVYPIENDRKEIEALTVKKILEIADHTLPSNFKGRVIAKCLFGDSPKDTFSDYVNTQKADLVIVAKREKKGLFESSFARFVNNHTKANILILKK